MELARLLADSGEEAQHQSVLVVIGPCPVKGRQSSGSPLSVGARPWCDVPAAPSSAKLAPRVKRHSSAPALAVSEEEAQHESF